MWTKDKVEDLVLKHQNKNTKTYFAGKAAYRVLLNKPLGRHITLGICGEHFTDLPTTITQIHFMCEPEAYGCYNSLNLDRLLVEVGTNRITGAPSAVSDMQSGIISFNTDLGSQSSINPVLIFAVAAIKADTEFKVEEKLYERLKSTVPKLGQLPSFILFSGLVRILNSAKPSIAINFLHEIGALDILLPELVKCYTVEQNPLYHKYTVYEHCLLACDLCPTEDIAIKFAALIHDVGKYGTKGLNEKGITFHRHEVLSAKLTHVILKRFGINNTLIGDKIQSLVANHMYQYDRKWKDSTVLKFAARVGITAEHLDNLSEFPLFILRKADRLGRGLDPETEKQADFELRIRALLSERLKAT